MPAAKAKTAKVIALPTRGKPRDPMLDQVLECMATSNRSLTWIAERSGVSIATLINWRSGKTRRPQNVTIDFVLRACGYKRGPLTRI